jgi:protocatechuate 3,4-dioxygenase, alpha subunit
MGIAPFQTVGPFFQVLVGQVRGRDVLVGDQTQGTRITIEGTVFDGDGAPITDALVEIWQADAGGHYRHPADTRDGGDTSFWGFGRAATDSSGGYLFDTIKPGAVPGPDGRQQAPHVLVSITARGVLTRYITRLYFADDERTATDPVLELVPAERRSTLIAIATAPNRYRFDIRIQGPGETVFFDV